MWRRLRTRCECYVASFTYPRSASRLGFAGSPPIANSKTNVCDLRSLNCFRSVVEHTGVRASKANSSTRASRSGVGVSPV